MKIAILIAAFDDNPEYYSEELVGAFLDPYLADEYGKMLDKEMKSGKLDKYAIFSNVRDNYSEHYIKILDVDIDYLVRFKHESSDNNLLNNDLLFDTYDMKNKLSESKLEIERLKTIIDNEIPRLRMQIDKQSLMITDLSNRNLELLKQK